MDISSGEAFSRTSRLTRAADYSQVFQHNLRIKDDCITLVVGKSSSGSARLGIAIAKKQIKKAVDRNRLKRLLRESFRKRIKNLPAVDIVIMVRYNILTLSNHEIYTRLEKLWQKVADKCEN